MDSGKGLGGADIPQPHASAGSSAAQTVGATNAKASDAAATDTGRIAGATAAGATDTGATAAGATAPGAGAGAAAAEEAKPEMRVGGPTGMLPDLRAVMVPLRFGFLCETEVRLMMADAARFLHQVTRLVSGVCGTVDVGGLRGEVAAHIHVSSPVIDEAGELLMAPRPAPETERADHRKGPRGRRSPMATLMALGVQAAKMLERITRAVCPVAHNVEPLDERLDREAAKIARDEARREPYANEYGG